MSSGKVRYFYYRISLFGKSKARAAKKDYESYLALHYVIILAETTMTLRAAGTLYMRANTWPCANAHQTNGNSHSVIRVACNIRAKRRQAAEITG
jgi:hypothetical protein